MSLADFCDTYLQGSAKLAARCYGGQESYWRSVYDEVMGCPAAIADVAAGLAAYEPSYAASCLASIETASCMADQAPAPCRQAIRGNIPVGGSCPSGDFDACVPEADCKTDALGCGGTCQARVAVNGACSAAANGSAPSCVEATSCVEGVCRKDVGEGQPCRGPGGASCADLLWCAGATATTPGTCQVGATSGPCTSSADCAKTYTCSGPGGAKTCSHYAFVDEPCVPGQGQCWPLLHCAADGKCTDAKAAENQPCGRDASGESAPCATGLYCDGLTSTAMGTCRPQKPAGAACKGAASECGPLGRCDTTTKLCVVCD